MSKQKIIYICKTHGCLGRSLCGKYGAVCAKSGVTVNGVTRCLAHGNTRCEHKIKEDK